MGTYVMSDLHGRYDRYKQMLELISFSDTDTLYILGDCIDRGVAGISILLDALQRNNTHLLLGNHEQMMIDALVKGDSHWRHVWENNGCRTTIAEYAQISDSDRERVRQLLLTLPVQEGIIERASIKEVAMPKIGCGLDRLSWPKVESILRKTFADVDIKITVCYL